MSSRFETILAIFMTRPHKMLPTTFFEAILTVRVELDQVISKLRNCYEIYDDFEKWCVIFEEYEHHKCGNKNWNVCQSKEKRSSRERQDGAS